MNEGGTPLQGPAHRGARPWRGLCLVALLAGGLPLHAQTQQLRANTKDEGWGPRQSSTSQGKLLWIEHDGGTNKDDVYLFDGASASLVQAQDALTSVGDIVFALGTGAAPGQVIAAWRRDTDFAWISTDGGTPVLVTATNPGNPAMPLNPEGAGIADGCVFLILQDASGSFPRKYVYEADPATGVATLLTDPVSFPVTGSDDGAPRITTSGCKAAWRYFDGSSSVKLHFWDGASVQVIDSGDIDLPHMSQGRVVYAKTVGGVSQVFLYDSNLPSPAPVALTSYTDPIRFNAFAKTDGRHVAWLRQNFDNTNRQIVLFGDVPLTTSASKPADGGIFVDFPIQMQRGQLLWKDASGALRYARDGAISTVSITPATSVIEPWLADGFVAFTGLSNDAGTDTEPFRFTGTPPSDLLQPSPPLLLRATPGDAQVTLTWDRILGATAYNLYYATVPGVTKANYASLPGGTRITGAAGPFTATGLANGTTYYFVVTAVDPSGEGPISAEASAMPRAARCVSAGTVGCSTTVQAAIDAASPGDTIRVTAGTYIESKIVGTFAYNLFVNKSVTIEGGWDSTFTNRDPALFVTTLLPSDSSFSVVAIEGTFGNPDAVAPVLDGFTITGGRADLGGNHGGGVRIRDSSATVRNCVITGNQAFLFGGGVWVQRGGPLLENNLIQNNIATTGGATLGGGVELEGTQATLTGNTITGNTIATSTGYGGGVAIQGGGLVALTNNTITNNAAATQAGAATDYSYGGGVSASGATVALVGNLISGNTANSAATGAHGFGGGLHISGNSTFTATGNTIKDNTAGHASGPGTFYLRGGGILVESSQGLLSGNVVTGNRANRNTIFGNGGGIAAVQSMLTITGGNIENNSASRNCEGYGGGLYASGSTITLDAVKVISNCAANTPFYGLGGGLAFVDSPFTITNTLIANNYAFGNDTSVGGLYASANSAGVLVNDTFANNRAQGIRTASSLTLANCILMGQTTGVQVDAAAAVVAKNNDFYNNTTNARGFALDSTNIVINPQLFANYSPTSASPCIDAGDNTRVPAGITADVAGRPRFFDDPAKPDTGVGAAPLVDIGAYEFNGSLGFHILPPCRIVDTRNAAGALGGPALVAGTGRVFLLANQCGIPAGAKAVSVNVTVTQSTEAGDLRNYPAGSALPLVSTINYGPGQTRANNAVSILGAAGGVVFHCDQAAGTVHLIVDTNGYFD